MSHAEHLDLALISGFAREEPLILFWPMDGIPVGQLTIPTPQAWREFVLSLSLPNGIPEIVQAKYRRAQMLYFLAWLYPDLIKAGELVGLTALELTVRDCYGNKVKGRSKSKPDFAALLQYMPKDGLTDDKIPMVQRSGGTAIGFVTGQSKPSLAERRNLLAHGDPFDALPCGGLLELVRDLIAFAYRDRIVPNPFSLAR
ncbi:MAG TPA: hypothetical protein VJQ82_28160 [Terriglobales bacterium]|nr:hypothetical protein [Terriglobales bacterium]